MTHGNHSPAPSLFSFGGGRQSTAALVLAAAGHIEPFDVWAFADVGADSENPDTVDYVHEHTLPFAERHDIDLRIIRWDRRGGHLTLYQYLHEMKRDIPIPVSFGVGGPSNRKCTNRFKIDPVARVHRKLGASAEQPGRLGIGFTVDELQRVRTDAKHPWQQPTYPLIDLGLTAADCEQVVIDAGLPKPPRSACWFCPFLPQIRWVETRRQRPELFDRAVRLEAMLSERAVELGNDPCTLHPNGSLLDITAQRTIFDEFDETLDPCSGSSCMT